MKKILTALVCLSSLVGVEDRAEAAAPTGYVPHFNQETTKPARAWTKEDTKYGLYSLGGATLIGAALIYLINRAASR